MKESIPDAITKSTMLRSARPKNWIGVRHVNVNEAAPTYLEHIIAHITFQLCRHLAYIMLICGRGRAANVVSDQEHKTVS